MDLSLGQNQAQGLRLSVIQSMLLDGEVHTNSTLPAFYHLAHLGGQTRHEILHPPGHAHVAFPDALDRPIKADTVPVIVLADGEQALEVVASAVQAQG